MLPLVVALARTLSRYIGDAIRQRELPSPRIGADLSRSREDPQGRPAHDIRRQPVIGVVNAMDRRTQQFAKRSTSGDASLMSVSYVVGDVVGVWRSLGTLV